LWYTILFYCKQEGLGEKREKEEAQQAAREQVRRQAEEVRKAGEAETKARDGAKEAMMRAFVPILCLLGLASAEWVTAAVNLTSGLIIHLVVFFCLVLCAFLTTQQPNHKLYLSLFYASFSIHTNWGHKTGPYH